MKKKSDNFITIILVLILFAGLSLLLYPSVSDYWNSFHQTKAITEYVERITELDQEEYQEMWNAALSYNNSLLERSNQYALDDVQKEQYENLLNMSGTGVMGYIEIPTVGCSLPIYHGTEQSVLQVAVGHLDWSSLPIGGVGSHCVLSGHRGLPSAKLFSDLDKLVIGDVFIIRVLDEVLTYEVDQILIVEPQNTEALGITTGEDYCTLVTCTPYGINSHRLLVRGHRVESLSETNTIHVTSDAIQIEPLIVASAMAIPVLVILFILAFLPKYKKKSRGDMDEEF